MLPSKANVHELGLLRTARKSSIYDICQYLEIPTPAWDEAADDESIEL